MKNKNNDGQSAPNRRDFIRLTVAGVAGSLAACATTQETDGAGASTGNSAPPQDRGLSENPPVAPEVGNLVDPERLAAETWQEPWTWRPDEWPGDPLELNVVGTQNPSPSPSPGNPAPALFSYNGISPAPTIRVRNDDELRIRVRNILGKNHEKIAIGHIPDFFALPPTLAQDICSLAGQNPPPEDPEDIPACFVPFYVDQFTQVLEFEQRDNWDMQGHINGLFQSHTTNIHTHGLHVFPQTNPDGSHSDNIFLRIIPKEDFEARKERHGEDAEVLMKNEHVGQLDYRYQLSFERDGERLPHPPGTHWYHPHSHGSTHDQVASGMAGYLIVEGDVDDAINQHMTGETRPRPDLPTGDFDYRERLIFLQRAFLQSFDNAAHKKKSAHRNPPFPSSDDARAPEVFRMRPGAVERWRVLNGSVDGSGTKRFMVLEGQFVQRNDRIWRVRSEGAGNARKRWLELATDQDFEAAKMDLHQLSIDGITLVRERNGKAEHWIKDLSKQNAGTANPATPVPADGENQIEAWLRAFESVWKDGDSLRRTFVRPNELYLVNANRADVFFKAPLNGAGKVYTIFAKEAHVHTDNMQQRLQGRRKDPDFVVLRDLFDVVAGYIHVIGEAVEGGDFDIQSLNKALPPVPPLLQPITENELRVPAAEAAQTGVAPGSIRTHTISYSGTGATSFPHIEVPEAFAQAHPELEKVTWYRYQGVPVLLQNLTATMGINPDFDLSANPDPMVPHKFGLHDPLRPTTLLNTAEEWAVYNCSQTLWAHTDRERFPQPGSYGLRYVSYPITRAEGQRRNAEDQEFQISAKSNDHPFHIHINPMWVLRIDVPDENGELHNILPEPAWMDTVPVPRNGGRVVFRSRFEDFTGTWINHCHVLAHEDNGMMQAVVCTDDPQQVNYHARKAAASHDMDAARVDSIYPKPSLEVMYLQNMRFVDMSNLSHFEFPGFDLTVPRLEDAVLKDD